MSIGKLRILEPYTWEFVLFALEVMSSEDAQFKHLPRCKIRREVLCQVSLCGVQPVAIVWLQAIRNVNCSHLGNLDTTGASRI